MPTIPVVWLHYDAPASPARGYWDQGVIEQLLSNRMWRTGYDFDHTEDLAEVAGGAVIVMPARAQVAYVKRLNEDLARLDWVVLILTGDEEASFPAEQVSHPNLRMWVMSPRPGRPAHESAVKLGTGFPPQLHTLMPLTAPDKTSDFFFAGQVTHVRRTECVTQLELLDGGECHPSAGFTQGLPPADYMAGLARAKVAPCPSGPETPDTFRLFEALEAGCVPVADTRVQSGLFPDDYWLWFFGEEPPFPILREYADLPHYLRESLADYPAVNNRVFGWWQHKKRAMARTLAAQIEDVSGIAPAEQFVTVVMSCSPMLSHPSTEIIEKTIASVRGHLPDVEILVMVDGVREESEHLRPAYEEYQRRLLWLCNYAWDNVIVLRHETFQHQSGMTPPALDLVETPCVLFVEHDTPLTPDWPIEWGPLIESVIAGDANVIRFHHEAHILKEHEHLMLGPVEELRGVKLRKTMQWSQRPHLASAAYYREMLRTTFRPEARAFIEHGMYGKLLEAVERDGIMGWNLHKVLVYHPDGVILRSSHLDGRQGAPNFDSTF